MGSVRLEAATAASFDELFRALSGLEGSAAPFPWQRALFAEFVAGRWQEGTARTAKWSSTRTWQRAMSAARLARPEHGERPAPRPRSQAIASPCPTTPWTLSLALGAGATTPDRATPIPRRIEGLLRKAITQAGFSQELADHAELEWRNVGFWPGADLADRYGVPDHLKRFPRFHVRVHWRNAHERPAQVAGPICLGGGRFYGLGLFARESDQP